MSASFPPVFLSYVRSASRPHAQRLHQALGGEAAGLCFLDTSDVESGDRLPETLVDALLAARVVVVFATPEYFGRWYCQLEFDVARRPSLHLDGAGEAERARVLGGLIVALPADRSDAVADWLPPDARVTVWPGQEQTGELAALVRARLEANPPTYRERLAAFTDPDAVREELRNASRLPRAPRGHGVLTVTPPGLSPSIGDAFVGRADELWRIHAALTGGAGAAGLTGSIEAGGGMGKTRLALEYFHRLGPTHFAGGLFWINAHELPGPQLRRVLDALDPAAPTDAELEARGTTMAEALRQAFRARPAGAPPALFVVDNVPEPEAEGSPRPLQTWCPALGEPGVAVLATSRMRVNAPGASVLPVPIGVLAPAAAVALLAPPGERPRLAEDEWREIAAWVGHLPLALELLRAALHHAAVSPGELLEQSREESPAEALDARRRELKGQIPDEHLPGISAALDISYRRLPADTQGAARLLAWLAPAPIPSVLVEEAPLTVFGREERSDLVSRHFVVRPEGSPAEFFGTMHRVVADFLRRQGDLQRDISDIAYWGLAQMLRAAEDDPERRVRLARAFDEPCRALLASVEAHGVEGEALEDALNLAGDLFVAAQDEGQLAVAEAVGDRLLPIAPRVYDPEGEGMIAFLRRLMLVYAASGNLRRVRDLTAEHPHAFRDLPDTVDSDAVMADLLEGMLSADQGHYGEAAERLEALLADSRADLGEGHELTVLVQVLLAYLPGLQGRPAEAIRALETLLAETADLVDPQTTEALLPRLLLEKLRREAGHDPASQAELASMVESALDLFGEHHVLTLMARQLERDAGIGGDTQGPTSAEIREMLGRLRESYGTDHYAVMAAERDLARQLFREGDHDGAVATYRGVCEHLLRMKGPHAVDVMNATVELGSLLRRAGRVDEARAVLEDVLARFEADFGEEHPDTIDAMKALALTLYVAKDRAGAQRLEERVLALYSRTLGDEHPKTFEAAVELFVTVSDRFHPLQAYRLASPWVPFLMSAPDAQVPEELVPLRKRIIREYPMPGFARRRMWRRLQKLAEASQQPPKPWWKFW
jgi:tetratricopeptide (TPR) repeat protein